MSVDKVVNIIEMMTREIQTHAISFTGGEPLLQSKFIKSVAERIDNKIALETNGILFTELESIIDCVDIVSMDIKLPNVVGKDLFEHHRKFIEVAKGKDLYIKIVISNDSPEEELISAYQMIASISNDIPLILQPVTPIGSIKPASTEKILSSQALASKYLNNVRVIPQTHKILNLL